MMRLGHAHDGADAAEQLLDLAGQRLLGGLGEQRHAAADLGRRVGLHAHHGVSG